MFVLVQAVTSALQRLDSQDQHVASEAAAALQRQYANSDRERDRQAAHLLQSVQHIDARTRESLQEVRQLIQRQVFIPPFTVSILFKYG
jgi:hypothetical protein